MPVPRVWQSASLEVRRPLKFPENIFAPSCEHHLLTLLFSQSAKSGRRLACSPPGPFPPLPANLMKFIPAAGLVRVI